MISERVFESRGGVWTTAKIQVGGRNVMTCTCVRSAQGLQEMTSACRLEKYQMVGPHMKTVLRLKKLCKRR